MEMWSTLRVAFPKDLFSVSDPSLSSSVSVQLQPAMSSYEIFQPCHWRPAGPGGPYSISFMLQVLPYCLPCRGAVTQGVGTCLGSGSVGVINSGPTSQVEVTSRVPRQVTTTLLLPLVVSDGGAAGLCKALTRSSRQSNLLPSPHSQSTQTATTSWSHCHGHRWRPAVL